MVCVFGWEQQSCCACGLRSEDLTQDGFAEGQNDEERGQSHVLWRASLARSSSSVSYVRPTNTEPMNEVHAITGLSGHLDRIKSFIRNLSVRAEFCLILLIGFGPLFIIFQLPTAQNTSS